MEAQLFKALGDPVRLKIIKRLSDGSLYTLGTLSKGLDISRQGARKQIQVLMSANLVRLKACGREVQVRLDLTSLHSGKDFLARLEKDWDGRLRKLKDVVEKQ